MRIFGICENVPVHFIIAGQLISKDNFLHMKRCFKDNVLILVKEGTLNICSNNKNYRISKNQFILLRAGEEHSGFLESSGYLSYYWCHFDNVLEEIPLENNHQYAYMIPETGEIENPTRLTLLFKQLMDFSLDKDFYNKKVLDFSLSIFLMEFTQNYLGKKQQVNPKKNPLINDVCNWIKNNFQKDFSIDDLAQNFNLQSSYLSKIFKQYMNKSLVQYITEIRIMAAKTMLQSFSIKETAYSCGFDDEKYFMKVFKKIEGVTPGQFKQAFSLRNVNQ